MRDKCNSYYKTINTINFKPLMNFIAPKKNPVSHHVLTLHEKKLFSSTGGRVHAKLKANGHAVWFSLLDNIMYLDSDMWRGGGGEELKPPPCLRFC